jgi:hypothetical protein
MRSLAGAVDWGRFRWFWYLRSISTLLLRFGQGTYIAELVFRLEILLGIPEQCKTGTRRGLDVASLVGFCHRLNGLLQFHGHGVDLGETSGTCCEDHERVADLLEVAGIEGSFESSEKPLVPLVEQHAKVIIREMIDRIAVRVEFSAKSREVLV